ncbi:hypothetical protein [Holospora undulata]|uniref:Uncharacterized protein n=1 Tax=Holospora undulata HU1 TaxID=1321371 RepID=A0A061JI25_9PROT|nr:hypothetical protein [Holospora undulata]ETZ04629.1 hypothetical protein K737_300949 [Holospora undulata HU1]
MPSDQHEISLNFQQNFLFYMQQQLALFKIPVFFPDFLASPPYILLSLKSVHEFFRGKAWYLIEVNLLNNCYSVELDRSIHQKLCNFSFDHIIFSYPCNEEMKKVKIYLDLPSRSYKEGKQNHSTLWTIPVNSFWITE